VLMFVAAVVFAVAAAAGFYRLMVGFPIIIGGVPIGQTASFFTFAISAALTLIFAKAAMRRA
jgi:hypothetical protein